MKKTMRWMVAKALSGIACGMIFTTVCRGQEPTYHVRPDVNPNGPCIPACQSFGFFDTNWRSWPGQPRAAEVFPESVGVPVIPTPIGTKQMPLPRAPILPNNNAPKTNGDVLPDTVLPFGSQPTPEKPGQDTTSPAMPVKPNSADKSSEPVLPFPKDTPLEGGIQGLGPIEKPTQPSGDQPSPLPKSLGPDATAPDSNAPMPDKTIAPNPSAQKPSSEPGPDIDAPAAPRKAPGDSSSRPRKVRQSADQASAAPSANRRGNARRVADGTPLPIEANWQGALYPETLEGGKLNLASFETEQPVEAKKAGPALNGFCPVQLCQNEKWVAGNPRLEAEYEGETYHFASGADLKRFLAAPERFVPACGGKDPVLLGEERRQVAGSIEHSAIWGKRLYLFSSSETLAHFRDDPERYAKPAQ